MQTLEAADEPRRRDSEETRTRKTSTRAPTFRMSWASYTRGDRIIVYASKVAACTGLNPYASADDLRDEFRRSVGLLQDFKTPEERGREELQAMPAAARKEIDTVVRAAHGDAAAVTRALDDVCAKYDNGVISDAARDVVRMEMYTRHGTRQESSVRQRWKDAQDGPVSLSVSSAFRVSAAPLMTVRGVKVYLGGRVDGLTDDAVVEVKTRLRRFLGTPDYERAQAHAYMHMLDRPRAILVESLNGVERSHTMERDAGFWGGVQSRLAEFLDALLELDSA